MRRRDFLTGTAAGAATLSAGSLVQAAADSSPRWDREVDVVVIGSGTGLLAALVAAKAGKRVLVLEKAAAMGGNTAVSGGVLWVPNNNIMQREGLSDTRDDALEYLRKLSLNQADEALLEAFVDYGPEMIDYMEAHTNIRWRVSKMMGDVADYHPEWAGAQLRGRSLEPQLPTVAMAGAHLSSSLMEALIAENVQVLTESPATRLVTEQTQDGQRRILGVQAEKNGSTTLIRALNGVVVASGGFERNPEMKQHFLRGPSEYTLGAQSNTGDGQRMGMDAGADLRNMNEVWGITVYTGDAKENGDRLGGMSLTAQTDRRNAGLIAVNRYGERFCNESADYDSTWRSYHTWENWGDLGYRNLPAFHLCDQRSFERYGMFGIKDSRKLPHWIAREDSLAELAETLGIDTKGLETTIKRYNHYAANGLDPEFHRGESLYDTYGSPEASTVLAPLDRGPFYGAQISPADLGTCGGLRVNGQAQVISVFGNPIEGLYASGNAAGVGSPGAAYGGGGGTIGPAMTFSYIAGLNVSK